MSRIWSEPTAAPELLNSRSHALVKIPSLSALWPLFHHRMDHIAQLMQSCYMKWELPTSLRMEGTMSRDITAFCVSTICYLNL